MAADGLGPPRGELLSQQWQWSWGRIDLTGLTGVELDLVPNPVGLVVAVVLLVLGALASWRGCSREVLGCAWRRSAWRCSPVGC